MTDQQEQRDALRSRLRNDLLYHVPPNEEARRNLDELRGETLRLGSQWIEVCPPGRDLSMALTHLEEAQRCAIAAIAKSFPLAE